MASISFQLFTDLFIGSGVGARKVLGTEGNREGGRGGEGRGRRGRRRGGGAGEGGGGEGSSQNGVQTNLGEDFETVSPTTDQISISSDIDKRGKVSVRTTCLWCLDGAVPYSTYYKPIGDLPCISYEQGWAYNTYYTVFDNN